MDVKHEPAAHRFVTEVEGHEAEAEYRKRDGVMVLTHTRVPEAIGGRGIAGELMKAAFGHARDEGLRVRPQCSYAAAWSRRHPEFADLVVD